MTKQAIRAAVALYHAAAAPVAAEIRAFPTPHKVRPSVPAKTTRSRKRSSSTVVGRIASTERSTAAITLRLSPETLAKFKAKGDDWRARMSKVLDQADV